MDPAANIFTVNSFLKKFDTNTRVKIISRELLFAFVILVVSLLSGLLVFNRIGFSHTSLNTTGAVLLLFIAFKMYLPENRDRNFSFDFDPYIIPISFPLIAGPTVISLLIILSSREPESLVLWVLAAFTAWLITSVTLILSPYFIHKIKQEKLRFIERIIAVILILLALKLLKTGLHNF